MKYSYLIILSHNLKQFYHFFFKIKPLPAIQVGFFCISLSNYTSNNSNFHLQPENVTIKIQNYYPLNLNSCKHQTNFFLPLLKRF